jgi:flagellar biosynthesis protein
MTLKEHKPPSRHALQSADAALNVFTPTAAEDSEARSDGELVPSDHRRIVGIGYAGGAAAPSVVLKGAGSDADALLAAATARDVPVIADAKLLEQLYRVPIDAPIGRDLFPIMAALLAHVLLIDREHSNAQHIVTVAKR